MLKSVTIDTDTTVHTLYGKQMGGRKSYNPKNKGNVELHISTHAEHKPAFGLFREAFIKPK